MCSASLPVKRRSLLIGGSALAAAAVIDACSETATRSTASAGATQSALSNAPVHLVINRNTDNFVTGTIGGVAVRMSGAEAGSFPTVTGELDKAVLSAEYSMDDQAPQGSGYVTTVDFRGNFGTRPTDLTGTFRMDSISQFEDGTIAGTSGNQAVHATANLSFGADSGTAANVKGIFAGVPFTLVGSLPYPSGFVHGTVGGNEVHLIVKPTGQPGNFPPLRVIGTYNGPPDLLALIIGSIAYFSA